MSPLLESLSWLTLTVLWSCPLGTYFPSLISLFVIMYFYTPIFPKDSKQGLTQRKYSKNTCWINRLCLFIFTNNFIVRPPHYYSEIKSGELKNTYHRDLLLHRTIHQKDPSGWDSVFSMCEVLGLIPSMPAHTHTIPGPIQKIKREGGRKYFE